VPYSAKSSRQKKLSTKNSLSSIFCRTLGKRLCRVTEWHSPKKSCNDGASAIAETLGKAHNLLSVSTRQTSLCKCRILCTRESDLHSACLASPVVQVGIEASQLLGFAVICRRWNAYYYWNFGAASSSKPPLHACEVPQLDVIVESVPRNPGSFSWFHQNARCDPVNGSTIVYSVLTVLVHPLSNNWDKSKLLCS